MNRTAQSLGVGALALMAGCSTTPTAGGQPAWQLVFDGSTLDRDLLSVWGTSARDVYAVGGPLGNSGYEAIVLHFDGSSWRELPVGGADSFWWVYGSGAHDVWMVGEKGRITHWDGATSTELARPTTATLYGVWAASQTDAWAVGGTPEGGTTAPNDLVFHWDGATWAAVDLPQVLGRTLFKVWGTSSDDLYVVGEYGTIWHKKGSSWVLESALSQAHAHGTLFTVFGCSANEIYTVGGRDVLRSDGTTWTSLGVSLQNDANGVACAASGEVLVDGFGGLKQRLSHGAWTDDSAMVPLADLHATWADPEGAFWVAGGDFVASPAAGKARSGILGRYGVGSVSTALNK